MVQIPCFMFRSFHWRGLALLTSVQQKRKPAILLASWNRYGSASNSMADHHPNFQMPKLNTPIKRLKTIACTTRILWAFASRVSRVCSHSPKGCSQWFQFKSLVLIDCRTITTTIYQRHQISLTQTNKKEKEDILDFFWATSWNIISSRSY
jgi:hypothetical protein